MVFTLPGLQISPTLPVFLSNFPSSKLPGFPVFFLSSAQNFLIFPIFWIKFPNISSLIKIPDFSLTRKCPPVSRLSSPSENYD